MESTRNTGLKDGPFFKIIKLKKIMKDELNL